MNTLINLINNPKNTFQEKHISLSVSMLFLTVISVTVFDPVLRFLSKGEDIDFLRMGMLTVYGFLGYGIFCIGLFIVCKIFGSKKSFTFYLTQWALTMVPTLLCGIVVTIIENYYYIFWNNSIWGMLLNVIFGGVLIWKVILYIIFLKDTLELKNIKLFFTIIFISMFILILAAFMGYIGLKTPII